MAQTTQVVNIHTGEHYDVYIGRPSIWGNPYGIGRDGTREQVIDKYQSYLLRRRDLLAKLPELKGKTLGCHCKPLACHGDVLVRFVAFYVRPTSVDKQTNRSG